MVIEIEQERKGQGVPILWKCQSRFLPLEMVVRLCGALIMRSCRFSRLHVNDLSDAGVLKSACHHQRQPGTHRNVVNKSARQNAIGGAKD